MTQEWIIKILASFGLSEAEVRIYFFLVTHGPLTAGKIADTLKLHRQQVYRVLRKLQCKGLANSSNNFPAVFSTLSFEEILDAFIKDKKNEASVLLNKRNKLLSEWRFIIERKKD